MEALAEGGGSGAGDHSQSGREHGQGCMKTNSWSEKSDYQDFRYTSRADQALDVLNPGKRERQKGKYEMPLLQQRSKEVKTDEIRAAIERAIKRPRRGMFPAIDLPCGCRYLIQAGAWG